MSTTSPPAGGGNLLTRKVGPLPGWAWGALTVGGVYLFIRWRAAKGTAATSTVDQASQAADSASTGAGVGDPSAGQLDTSGADFAQLSGSLAGIENTLSSISGRLPPGMTTTTGGKTPGFGPIRNPNAPGSSRSSGPPASAPARGWEWAWNGKKWVQVSIKSPIKK